MAGNIIDIHWSKSLRNLIKKKNLFLGYIWNFDTMYSVLVYIIFLYVFYFYSI